MNNVIHTFLLSVEKGSPEVPNKRNFLFFLFFSLQNTNIFSDNDKIFNVDKQYVEKKIANIFGLYHKLVYLCIVKMKQKVHLLSKKTPKLKTTQLWKTQMNKKR